MTILFIFFSVHDASGLVDNVAESESEDEWNYIKGEVANKENIPPQPEREVGSNFFCNSILDNKKYDTTHRSLSPDAFLKGFCQLFLFDVLRCLLHCGFQVVCPI